jgi:DNA-binding HxlR family transcriptional regulator/putative sterol carrier protein
MGATQRARKTYDQYCPVARTLDVVGERWTLLIVRDLLMGPKRYTDLRAGLPGIATDILTARLRTLEQAGLVRRRELPPPAPATVYELTGGGLELRHAILALGQAGISTLGGPKPGEDIRAERLVLGLRVSFRRDEFADLAETYELTIGGEPFTVDVHEGTVDTRPGTASSPAIRLRTEADTFARLLTGELAPAAALADDHAVLEGEREVLERFVQAFGFGRSRVTDVMPKS